MTRCTRIAQFCIVGSALAVGQPALAVVLPFSEPDFDWNSQGGGTEYHLYTAGDYWEQQFNGTGVNTATSLALDLVIENDIGLSFQDMSFDVFLNGNDVGDFTLLANTAGLYHFDYSFGAIAGDSYLVHLEGSSTIDVGLGSFSLALDASSVTIVPTPAAPAVLGVVGIMARRRRRG